ncbi:HNH endonuclease [Shewanella sp. MF05960]|uniref:HNH endonuclease n=1 Tax=Shewanella sp. MF05960 TaxID=3434874 RepID=UPI003D7B25A2
MATITSSQYQAALSYALNIKSGSLSLSKAIDQLVVDVALGAGSAKDYLVVLSAMLEGHVYKRTIKIDAYNYYFKQFSHTLSVVDFAKVIHATELHLDYYSTLGRGNQLTVRSLVDSYKAKLTLPVTEVIYPDDVPPQPTGFTEGALKQVTINAYERDPKARKACIAKFGAICQVCDFDFEKTYGAIGKGFIHVHHKVDLATIHRQDL